MVKVLIKTASRAIPRPSINEDNRGPLAEEPNVPMPAGI